MTDINLPIIVGASLIDGINPCAFGVLIFLLAYLAKTSKKKSKMLVNGLVYIFAVFLTYLFAGLLLLPIIQSLGSFSVYSYIVLAIIVIIAGLLEIKDYFWYGKGFSLSIFPSEAERIKKYVKSVSGNPLTAFALGVFVALVELPCTGAVYLAVLALMSFTGVSVSNILFLIIYNIIFVLPLVIILLLVYRQSSTIKFEKWRQKHKGLMRLITGFVLLALGLWMIFTIL
ncbi:MAG: GAP family protein [Nanoarchaeota archaeon]